MTSVGIGVIGTGWWATQFHIPSVLANPDASLRALADRDSDRLDAASVRYSQAASYNDHKSLLADPSVDAVVIATPHSSHFELARDALLAGKHVLVEKPLSLDTADAYELKRLAVDAGLALVVGHTYHHTRLAQRAREIILSGTLGEITFVSGLFASMVTSYYSGRPDEYDEVFHFPVTGPAADTYSNPALSGGGQGWTQMTHLVDMIFWVTGLRCNSVFARMSDAGLPVDLVDSTSFTLSNGALGTAGSTGQLLPGQSQQQEIRYYGTQGYILQELIHGTLEVVYNDGTKESLDPLTSEEIYPAMTPVASLIDIASGRTPVPSDGADSAIATVEFLQCAYRSARSGHDQVVPAPPAV
jgi:predicted dehydrogenase